MKEQAVREFNSFVSFSPAGITTVNGKIRLKSRQNSLIFSSDLGKSSLISSRVLRIGGLSGSLYYLCFVSGLTFLLKYPLIAVNSLVLVQTFLDKSFKTGRNIKTIEFEHDTKKAIFTTFLGKRLEISDTKEIYLLLNRMEETGKKTLIPFGYKGKNYAVPLRNGEIHDKTVFSTLLRGYEYI